MASCRDRKSKITITEARKETETQKNATKENR